MSSNPALGVDPFDQLNDWIRPKWDKAQRRTKRDPSSEHARVSKGQRDTWGARELRVTDIHDVGQCNSFFETPIPDEQHIAAIQDLVDKIKYHLFHEEKADDEHEHRHYQER
jgi:hypothetical protein